MTDDEVAPTKSLFVRLVEKGFLVLCVESAAAAEARLRLRSSSDLLLATATKRIFVIPFIFLNQVAQDKMSKKPTTTTQKFEAYSLAAMALLLAMLLPLPLLLFPKTLVYLVLMPKLSLGTPSD